MLTIRFTRKGRKNQPFFRVVVVDKRRSSKGGRAVEELGYVDPLTKKRSLNKERASYWLSVGAQPSPTVHNLFVAEKIIDAKKINVSKKSKKVVEETATPPVASEAPSATTEVPVSEATTEAPSEAQKTEEAPKE